MVIPEVGDRVRVVELGPNDAWYAVEGVSEAIGSTGVVFDVEERNGWLGLGLTGAGDFWCFAQCHVEIIEKGLG